MPKKASIPRGTEEDRKKLNIWTRSRTLEAQLVERAKIIIKCLEGRLVNQIAKELDIRPNTVIDWRRRFEKEGISGLHDRARPGKPAVYGP
jgi:transposase